SLRIGAFSSWSIENWSLHLGHVRGRADAMEQAPERELVDVGRAMAAEQAAGEQAHPEKHGVSEDADQDRVHLEIEAEVDHAGRTRLRERAPRGERNAGGDPDIAAAAGRAPREKSEEEQPQHAAG